MTFFYHVKYFPFIVSWIGAKALVSGSFLSIIYHFIIVLKLEDV